MIGRLFGGPLLLLLPVAAAAHGEHGSASPLETGQSSTGVAGTKRAGSTTR